MYSQKLLALFETPKNVGELSDANGIGIAKEPLYGNVVKIWIIVEGDNIVSATFKSNGCVPIIASASILTEIVMNKTIEAALETRKVDIVKALGGLPPKKHHCALLALKAFKTAVQDYLNNGVKKH